VTTITEPFTYADGELSTLNASWVEYTLGYSVVSNQIKDDTSSGAHAAFIALSSSDQHVERKIVTRGIASGAQGVVARASSIGTADTSTGAFYWLRFAGNAPTSLVLVKKAASSGTVTTVGTVTLGTALNSGDTIALEVEGSAQRVYVNGTLQGTYADTAIGTGTFVGMRDGASDAVWDDFAANDLAGGPPATAATLNLGLALTTADVRRQVTAAALSVGWALSAAASRVQVAASTISLGMALAVASVNPDAALPVAASISRGGISRGTSRGQKVPRRYHRGRR
jgi:hypothetical protein